MPVAVPAGATVNVPSLPGSVAARSAEPGPSPENHISTSTVVDSRRNFQYENVSLPAERSTICPSSLVERVVKSVSSRWVPNVA